MLEGKIRESISRSEIKALRKDGYLIANIYGKGQENIHCAVKRNEFIKFVKAKDTLIFPIKVGDKVLEVVIQEYQKDPVTSEILHVDLHLAIKGILSQYLIPVKLNGIAKGLKDKGVLILSKKRIKVKAKAEDIPNFFELDITELDVGNSILIRDLPATKGIALLDGPNVAIVGIIKAK